MNKDMLVFLKGLSIVVILLLMSTPLILMNVFQGNLSGPWIGFWGSFAGGILGTAGVIYVAHLQNKAQKESLETIESHNRERLSIQTKLEMLDDYSKKLNDLKLEIDKYKNYFSLLMDKYHFYILNDSLGYDNKTTRHEFEEVHLKFKYLGNKHFLDLFSTIDNTSKLLSRIEGIEINDVNVIEKAVFERLDQTVSSMKYDSIISLMHRDNIFDQRNNLKEYPFETASKTIDSMRSKVINAQGKLIKKIDAK